MTDQSDLVVSPEVEAILANDRAVIKTLVDTIILHVPRASWPMFVERCYQETVADIMSRPASEPEEAEPQDEQKEGHVAGRIRWDDQPLGEMTDTELAERLGVSGVAVGKARRLRGIRPFGKGTGRPVRPRGPGQRAGIVWDDQPLGQVPDKELARRLDVDPASVRSARLVRERRAERRKAELGDRFTEAMVPPPPTPVMEPVPPEAQEVLEAEPPEMVSTSLSSSIVRDEDLAGPPWSCPCLPPRPSGPPSRPPASEEAETPASGSPASRTPPRPRAAPPHVHRCPVCRRDRSCGDTRCELGLETEEGEPMSFRTCDRCVTELGKETTGQRVPVGGSFGQMGEL